jgi:hypothetical protein
MVDRRTARLNGDGENDILWQDINGHVAICAPIFGRGRRIPDRLCSLIGNYSVDIGCQLREILHCLPA